MNRNDYIAPTKLGDEKYEEVRALAIAEGIISTDAKPAALGYSNGAWSVEAA